MSKEILEVSIELESGQTRTVLVTEWTLTKGTPDYFDASMEQWYPGDPEEFFIEGARWKDTGLELTPAEKEQFFPEIEDGAYEMVMRGN